MVLLGKKANRSRRRQTASWGGIRRVEGWVSNDVGDSEAVVGVGTDVEGKDGEKVDCRGGGANYGGCSLVGGVVRGREAGDGGCYCRCAAVLEALSALGKVVVR